MKLPAENNAKKTFFTLSCRQEREANFAQKKAERATVRSHFREKYRLPKVNESSSASQKAIHVGIKGVHHMAHSQVITTSSLHLYTPHIPAVKCLICVPSFCLLPCCVMHVSTSERDRWDPDPTGGGWRGVAHRAGQDDCWGQPGGDAQAVSAGPAVKHPECGHRPAERQSPGHVGRPQKADREL